MAFPKTYEIPLLALGLLSTVSCIVVGQSRMFAPRPLPPPSLPKLVAGSVSFRCDNGSLAQDFHA